MAKKRVNVVNEKIQDITLDAAELEALQLSEQLKACNDSKKYLDIHTRLGELLGITQALTKKNSPLS